MNEFEFQFNFKLELKYEITKIRILNKSLKYCTEMKPKLLIDEMSKIEQNLMNFFVQSCYCIILLKTVGICKRLNL
jgi:hypothetical protein